MTQHGILYEVVIAVSADVHEAYLDWLRGHMRTMLEIEGFLSAELYEDSENPNLFTCT